ncbi:uncharacterized protein LOC132556685 [Ylistrum balloti]|uniref:uncharacterized protein LOC132556685 n=1 Tax=Ylistrum balloti TaxID=509963 RepID=UPI002905A344|nr:uncharacterized protein LOC132556685 [Ylistrum balloti]
MKTICLFLYLGQLMWFSSACMLCCQCGSFSPDYPFYYTNDTSNLTCSLDNSSTLVSASDLYITKDGKEMDPAFLTVVNETTVRFQKVVSKEDDGEYQCRIRRVPGSSGLIGTLDFKVDDRIQPIKEIQCVWHNWKDKLICSWSIPPYRYMQYIKVKLIWFNSSLRYRYNGASNICPHMENMTVCTWETTDASLDTSPWHFKLTVYNTQVNDSEEGPWITKIVKDNVKPSAVESFQQHYTDKSTCLLLTWTYDKSIAKSRLKYYRIQYFPVADPSQLKEVWSDSFNVTICQLTPYTEYNFTIAVHPNRNAVKGYWSDPVSKWFQTDQDIPVVPPEMFGCTQSNKTCFKEGGNNINSYTVFWKALPEEDSNGEIISYNVTYTDISSSHHHTDSTIRNKTDISVNLRLHCDKLYNVSINAATKKGYSPYHSSLIINTTGTSLPVVMVERNNSLYNVSWTVPWHVDSLISFSVVYCKQLGSQQNCITPLDVPGSYTRSQTLSLTSNTMYLFGVSVIRDGVTSAAMFESCVYVVTERQEQLKVIPSTSKTEYIISNLEKDVQYGVRMLSSSSSQSSRLSGMKYGTPTNNDITVGFIAGIVVASIFVAVLVMAGIFFACKKTKSGIVKLKTPYDIDVPQLDKDSSPNSSTGSCRSTDNSQQALLPKQHSVDFSCHNNPGQNHFDKSKNATTKRQFSRDSGRGGSLSSEPDYPDRLYSVPEDNICANTKMPGGDGYTSKIRDTSGIESFISTPYSVIRTTQSEGSDEQEPSVEQNGDIVSDHASEVHISPSEITVMFVVDQNRESDVASKGYNCHEQIMSVPTFEMVQSGKTGKTTAKPVVIKDISPTMPENAVQSSTTCTHSSGAASQESPACNSSGPLSYTMMDTSSSQVGPMGPGLNSSTQLSDKTSAEDRAPENPDGYSTLENLGTYTNDGYTTLENLGTYTNDGYTTQENLGTCTSDGYTTQENLGTCTSDGYTTQENLGTCTSDGYTTQENLGTYTSDGYTTQENLGTYTSDGYTTQENLGT